MSLEQCPGGILAAIWSYFGDVQTIQALRLVSRLVNDITHRHIIKIDAEMCAVPPSLIPVSLPTTVYLPSPTEVIVERRPRHVRFHTPPGFTSMFPNLLYLRGPGVIPTGRVKDVGATSCVGFDFKTLFTQVLIHMSCTYPNRDFSIEVKFSSSITLRDDIFDVSCDEDEDVTDIFDLYSRLFKRSINITYSSLCFIENQGMFKVDTLYVSESCLGYSETNIHLAALEYPIRKVTIMPGSSKERIAEMVATHFNNHDYMLGCIGDCEPNADVIFDLPYPSNIQDFVEKAYPNRGPNCEPVTLPMRDRGDLVAGFVFPTPIGRHPAPSSHPPVFPSSGVQPPMLPLAHNIQPVLSYLRDNPQTPIVYAQQPTIAYALYQAACVDDSSDDDDVFLVDENSELPSDFEGVEGDFSD